MAADSVETESEVTDMKVAAVTETVADREIGAAIVATMEAVEVVFMVGAQQRSRQLPRVNNITCSLIISDFRQTICMERSIFTKSNLEYSTKTMKLVFKP